MASDTETNEAFPGRETNLTDFDNSENIVRKGRETARRSSQARSTRGLANEAWALYKSNRSRVSWVELSRDRYIA